MSIKVIKPGLYATLQANSRQGYRSVGIGSSGAMDDFAFSVANYLVGNDEYKAAIEINFPATEILFEQDALIAITGANFSAKLNDENISLYKPILVKSGSLLQFEKLVSGSKGYIAIHKGWQAIRWLGSYSTNVVANAGGFNGRVLQNDDPIGFEQLQYQFSENKILPWQLSSIELQKIYEPINTISCVEGPEWYWLHQKSKEDFSQQLFTLSIDSNRMGYRFNNAPLQKINNNELVSSAVDAGTIQLLPNGSIIILMADCQTTGGYPRIASVLKTDLPKMAQLKPGEKINCKIVSLQQAEDVFINYTKVKQQIQASCMHNFKNYFSAGY